MSNDRDRKVRDRAYALWESEGRPAGRHDDHWYRASNEVDTDPPSAPEPTPAAKAEAKPRATKTVKAAIPTSDKPYPKDEGADDLEKATTKAKRAAPRKAAAVRPAPAAKASAAKTSAGEAATPVAEKSIAKKPAAPARPAKSVKSKPAA